jgi:hypothetical protein
MRSKPLGGASIGPPLTRSWTRANSFYFDGLVWHVYSRPVDILERMSWSRARLSSTVGLKPIWINETNVPAWDESAYNNRRPYQWAATAQEQASYIIQSFAHSVVAGVDKVLVYRFHDVGEPQAWGLVPRRSIVATGLRGGTGRRLFFFRGNLGLAGRGGGR